jgi:hypothetical protein
VTYREPFSTVVGKFRCPCGAVHDSAACLERDATPEEGQFSVCVDCGRVQIFGKGLRLRNATPAEIATAPLEVRARLDQYSAVARLLRARRRQN